MYYVIRNTDQVVVNGPFRSRGIAAAVVMLKRFPENHGTISRHQLRHIFKKNKRGNAKLQHHLDESRELLYVLHNDKEYLVEDIRRPMYQEPELFINDQWVSASQCHPLFKKMRINFEKMSVSRANWLG